MTQARHFDITEWADYVRNVVSAEQHREMLTHLQSGCSKCEKLQALLSRLVTICLRETSFELPRYAEQQVKALMGLARTPRRSALARLLGSLIYDSRNDPQPAGVRGTHQINRQVMFHADRKSVV